MNNALLVSAAGLLLVVVAAHAADAPPPALAPQAVAVSASAAASAPALICQRETPTGSTIAHRVCKTPDQIDAEARQVSDFKRQIQYESGAAAQQRLKGQ